MCPFEIGDNNTQVCKQATEGKKKKNENQQTAFRVFVLRS